MLGPALRTQGSQRREAALPAHRTALEVQSPLRHDVHMTPDQRALALAARQGGVITLPQAVSCGLSRSGIKRRVDRGDWRRIFRSTYQLIEMVEAKDLLLAAAFTLPSAVVSHEFATELHEFPHIDRGRAVVSVHTRPTHTFPGVTVHRNHDLAGEHVVEINGLLVTSIPRTIRAVLDERSVDADSNRGL